VRFYKVPKS